MEPREVSRMMVFIRRHWGLGTRHWQRITDGTWLAWKSSEAPTHQITRTAKQQNSRAREWAHRMVRAGQLFWGCAGSGGCSSFWGVWVWGWGLGGAGGGGAGAAPEVYCAA